MQYGQTTANAIAATGNGNRFPETTTPISVVESMEDSIKQLHELNGLMSITADSISGSTPTEKKDNSPMPATICGLAYTLRSLVGDAIRSASRIRDGLNGDRNGQVR